jgi:multidrug transporter EmrE-like cation transporter
MSYIYILLAVLFVTCAQLVLKWRVSQFPPLPDNLWNKCIFLIGSVFDPYVFGSFFGAFIGSLCWIAAMTQLNVSTAYPVFVCSLLIFITLGGVVLFGERISTTQIIGIVFLLIGLGLFVIK